MTNERVLLASFLNKMTAYDPDIIVGHHVFGFGLDVLMHRLAATTPPNWSRIGRLRRSAYVVFFL